MTAAQPFSKPERNKLRKVLTQWRVPRTQAKEILRHAVFGPGAVVVDSDEMDGGVGIMVDETRDFELAEVLDRRASLGDREFAAQWETNTPRAEVVLCPHAPEAIFAYTVNVLRPVRLTRTYLLLVSKHARALALLCQSGTTIWLVSEAVALREWAREGTGTAYDLYSRALPVGRVRKPPIGVDSALRHVGYRALQAGVLGA